MPQGNKKEEEEEEDDVDDVDDDDDNDDDNNDDDDDDDDDGLAMASYLHDGGQAGRSVLSPGKLGTEKEAEEVGDARNLFLHWKEGCLANSPSSLTLSKANKQYKGKPVGLNRRAMQADIDNKLMNNIAPNPGPRTTIQKAARTG